MKYTKYTNTQPFDFKGLQIRELAPAEMESISIAEIEVAPGLKHPTARSTKCDKVYICTRGQISFWVNDNNIELKPRDSLLINKGEWFRYENNTEFPGELHLIHTPRFDMAFEEFKDD